jgi:BioD-like phosphotransacetylase family protein
MRHLYLAATGQNRGKTTTALGFLDGFVREGLATGFMKPVGQRTVIQDGAPADEDAVLMKTVFNLPEPLRAMSPVHIPRGFTKAYIAGEVVEDLGARIRAAHESFVDRDVLLVEGTGHAGVGAVIGLSNAVVAAMLDAPVVVVSEGGVGRPVNKVELDAQPGIVATLERGLALHGVPLLGVLPYRPILSNPTLGMVLEGVRGEALHAGPDLDAVIDGVAIGAMEPGHMLERVGPRTLVIVPGDREDVILTLTSSRADGGAGAALGLVLTGGYRPRQAVIDAISRADLFATLVGEDTYAVASKVHDLLVKTHAADREKIELIKALVADHLDIDRILDAATAAR